MSEKYDGWILKNKRGTFCTYFFESRKRDVIQKIGDRRWEAWESQGCKIVKVKLIEVINTCQKPDRDVPKLICGHPLPCPHHREVKP